jgi:hypothetical protein
MSRGFDVEFHDMERGGGHDFTARKGEVEVEVGCKMAYGAFKLPVRHLFFAE